MRRADGQPSFPAKEVGARLFCYFFGRQKSNKRASKSFWKVTYPAHAGLRHFSQQKKKPVKEVQPSCF
jgi:hypothetical protein